MARAAERIVKTLLIADKELRVAAASPLPYVLVAMFSAICGFFFVTRLVLYSEYSVGAAVIANFWFAFLAGAPYSVSSVLVLVIPLLTMRAFAEERRSGTLELLLTFPVRDSDVLLGKFTATMAIASVLLAIVAGYAVVLSWYVPVPWAAVAVGLLGLWLLLASFTACGLFFSSLTESQVVAALGSGGVLVLCWLVTWNEAAFRTGWLAVLRQFSAFDHFERLARGLLALEDVTYFVTATALFHFLTLRVLAARTWQRRG